MRGKFTAAIAVIAAIILIAAPAPLIAPVRTLSAAKIVSVVFDDSGSMSGNANWAYANYATQAFRGLLNKEDKLYITYMSDYTNPIEFNLTGDTQKQVDKIRGHFEAAGTPIEAVETAILYQILAYVKNEAIWIHDKEVRGMLLYPQVDVTIKKSYVLSGSNLYVQTIDLNQEFRLIKQELLDICAYAIE